MNVHVNIKAYMIEDDLALFNLDDGKYLHKATDFLTKQADVVQVEVNSQKLMPEHEKDRKSKEKVETDRAEHAKKKERIAAAQAKLEAAKKKKSKKSKSKKSATASEEL